MGVTSTPTAECCLCGTPVEVPEGGTIAQDENLGTVFRMPTEDWVPICKPCSTYPEEEKA